MQRSVSTKGDFYMFQPLDDQLGDGVAVDQPTPGDAAWARAFLIATYDFDIQDPEGYVRICAVFYDQEVPEAFSDRAIDYSRGALETLGAILVQAERFAGVMNVEHLTECTELDNEFAWLGILKGLGQLPRWAAPLLARSDLEAYHTELSRRHSLVNAR